MKLLNLTTLLTASLLTFSACSSAQPSPQKEIAVDDTLPVIELTKNGIITDMTSVAFEWQSIKDPRVEEIYIYRTSPSTQEKEKMEYYESLHSRFKTHYVDFKVKPGTLYTYSFRTVTKDAQGKLSEVYKVNTKPVLHSVAWIHSITGLPRSAKIIWRPHSNQRVEKYLIERKTLDDEEWRTIDTVMDRLSAEYLDTDLKDNYVYKYRVRVKTYDGIISTPSEVVKVVTKPLPQPITNITATHNRPKEIKIDWSATTQKDFDRYYLYRSSSVDGSYELIAKLYNNTFVDKIEKDGERYFYRVSVVDKDALESEHDKLSIMGMTLQRPMAPAVFKADLQDGAVHLNWSKVDPRSESYIVVKESKKGWFDTSRDEFREIKQTSFIDKAIEPNSKYTYTVYSLDQNKILSEASEPVVIVTPESDTYIEAPKAKEQTVQKAVKPAQTEPVKQEIITPSEDLQMDQL